MFHFLYVSHIIYVCLSISLSIPLSFSLPATSYMTNLALGSKIPQRDPIMTIVARHVTRGRIRIWGWPRKSIDPDLDSSSKNSFSLQSFLITIEKKQPYSLISLLCGRISLNNLKRSDPDPRSNMDPDPQHRTWHFRGISTFFLR